MDKKILVALSGGQETAYLLTVLRAVAEREQSSFGYYRPCTTSREACVERIFVTVGAQTACKEFLPETADVLVALEELEGRRGVRFLKKEGVLILCAMHRLPMAVAVGTTGYPTDVLYRSVSEGRNVWQVKRAECTPAFIAAITLRALGYERETAEEILLSCGLTVDEESVRAVYAKEYSK